jgi:hypothetical protein
MEHELRAEYQDGPGPDGQVKTWHVVREDSSTAMCGRDLSPDSATRSVDEWGSSGISLCHSCGALFLRESP